MSAHEAGEACRLAQNLARNAGYAAFPVKLDKTPATPRGFLDAKTQPDEIARLWRRHPGPLVGVATGARSGISVLDVDSGDWPEGASPAVIERHQAARFWWHRNADRIPATRIFATRSGGLHAAFRHRDGVGSTQGRIHQGIDTRGDGGYAVWWYASGHPCHCHEPPAPWPDWLFAPLIEPAPTPRLVQPAPRRRAPVAPGAERVIENAMRLVTSAPEGQKHERLRQAARLLGGVAERAGFTDAEAAGWLVASLPDTVKDWSGAQKTALWAVGKGRQAPLDLGARR